MSDPRYTDPRLSDPAMHDESRRAQRLSELEQSNTMWGWIAGGIVLALLMVFIFGRGPNSTDVARTDNGIPPASTTTGAAPTRNAIPPASTTQAPRPMPSTTGQSSQ